MFSYTYYKTGDAYNTSLPRLHKIFNSHDDKQWNFPYHLHEDHLEIAYIERGNVYYKIDMHSETARQGDLVILNAKTLHTVSVSDSVPSSIWVLHADNFSFPELEKDRLCTRNYSILSLNQHADFIGAAFYELARLYPNKLDRTLCQIIVSSMLTLIHNLQQEQELDHEGSYSDFAREIMQYLNEHFKESLSLEEIAGHFYLSKSRFSHLFTDYFGISPINYLIDRKICEAKWMLTSSDLPIETISVTLGYENVSYFKNLFAKRTGNSPSEFRRLYSEPSAEKDSIYADKQDYRL